MRQRCLRELSPNGTRVNRVRLLLCGASGVGKTSLLSSLRTKFLRTLRRPTFGGSYLGSSALDHTYGFCMQRLLIPNAGEFSVWDFSGRKQYYPAHEYFLDCRNGLYLIVYRSADPLELQLAQVRFWLAMIKSKHKPHPFIHFAGHYIHKPFVILVSSFSDTSPNSGMFRSTSGGSGFEEEDDFLATSPLSEQTTPPPYSRNYPPTQERFPGRSASKSSVLQYVVHEFGDHFNFTDTVFQLDTRQPRGREMKRLRTLLGILRTAILDVRTKS